MNPEEINRAVAECCGWRFDRDGSGFMPPNSNEWIGRGYKALSECIPNYCGNLNAMHEAEKTINLQDYVAQLRRVVDSDWNEKDAVAYCCATAAQRAEAFLRTVGKWKEAP